MINHLPYSAFWGHLMITEALWRASVCNGYRYSTLWAYPLITGICLEGNAEEHLGWLGLFDKGFGWSRNHRLVTRRRRRNFVNMKEPRPETVTKRAERAKGRACEACFEQPEDVYSGCVDARPGMYTFVTQSIHEMRLQCECLFIPHHGNACRMTFS